MRRKRSWLKALAIALALGLPAVPAAFGAEAGTQKISDMDISSTVEEEIHFSPAVDLNDITVRTREGVVTLTG